MDLFLDTWSNANHEFSNRSLIHTCFLCSISIEERHVPAERKSSYKSLLYPSKMHIPVNQSQSLEERETRVIFLNFLYLLYQSRKKEQIAIERLEKCFALKSILQRIVESPCIHDIAPFVSKIDLTLN